MEQGTQDIIKTFENTLLESNRPDIHVREDVLRYMLHNITQVCFEKVFRVTIKAETIHQAYYMIPFETQMAYKNFSTTNENLANCLEQMSNMYNSEDLIKLLNNMMKSEPTIEKPIEKPVEKQVIKPSTVIVEKTIEKQVIVEKLIEKPVEVIVEKPVVYSLNKKPDIEITEKKKEKAGINTKQNEIMVEITEEGNDKPQVIKLVEKIYKDKPVEMIDNPVEHEESEEESEESLLNGMSSEELQNMLLKMKKAPEETKIEEDHVSTPVEIKIEQEPTKQEDPADKNTETRITNDKELKVDKIKLNCTVKSQGLPILIDSDKHVVSERDFGTNSTIITLKKKKRDFLDIIEKKFGEVFTNRNIKSAYNSKRKVVIMFNKFNIIHNSKSMEFESIHQALLNDEFGIKKGVRASFVFSIIPVEQRINRNLYIKFYCECQRMIIY